MIEEWLQSIQEGKLVGTSAGTHHSSVNPGLASGVPSLTELVRVDFQWAITE